MNIGPERQALAVKLWGEMRNPLDLQPARVIFFCGYQAGTAGEKSDKGGLWIQ